ncbi:MAG: hypothetical protein NT124_02475 [Candidatus Dependentiae bacterium]|nr:hypothetical protein [Candidatus Dependentiae bacterium]
MKNSNLVFLILAATIGFVRAKQEEFKIILEPKWENLEHDELRIVQFGGKWILAGSITFKKKSKEMVNLSRLTLLWTGPHLDKLSGSLYEKNFEKIFYPIQDFLISDGIWNKKQQFLAFNFDQKCSLQAVNTFYLVLTVPPEQETILKNGSFFIANDSLPSQFKEHINTSDLSLSFNTIGKKLIVASHKI